MIGAPHRERGKQGPNRTGSLSMATSPMPRPSQPLRRLNPIEARRRETRTAVDRGGAEVHLSPIVDFAPRALPPSGGAYVHTDRSDTEPGNAEISARPAGP